MATARRRSDRRKFLKHAPAAVAIAALAPVTANAQETGGKPVKKVHWSGGKAPEKPPLFSPVVQYGSLLFVSGVGAHFEGDIKAHTKHVLDEIQQKLEAAGSSMEKVLKVNVYLTDMNNFAGMNEAYINRFGPNPPVRTTVAVVAIPDGTLVEIDCMAYI